MDWAIWPRGGRVKNLNSPVPSNFLGPTAMWPVCNKEAYLYDFPWDQEVKTTTGEKQEDVAFLAGNFKANSINRFQAFCYIVRAALDMHDYKGLE